MRLGCPKCGARYEVPSAEIPDTGREVQCSACDHRWIHAAPPAVTATAPDTAPRPRPTDPNVLKILREEAQREIAAREREAEDRTGAAASRTEPVAPRRALLPEIEEPQPDARVVIAPEEPERSGFLIGFVIALVLAALAAAAYLWSAELAEAVPALAEPLAAYVEAVDSLRRALADAVNRTP
ncbi:zinc-ribbon domain-containing protein [Pararhodobacter sp. SW119]|uniref:zinc-ribbon domain-containing protein n=1 Tax=Pararhodobacter sp. SW119 TaxID=2780075 RepID=UPI001AE0A302|nr:zinc-ribbon domain-containing protein [Pararhodobacter sp. SW119]